MNTSEILRQAADVVRSGWTRYSRHATRDGRGEVCAIGALERVVQRPWAAETACPDEMEALAAVLPGHSAISTIRQIADWTNADDQTAENVALTLEYAALVWDQQQAAALAETPEGEPA